MPCTPPSSVDCEIFEVWRYMDSFGLTSAAGTRSGQHPPGGGHPAAQGDPAPQGAPSAARHARQGHSAGHRDDDRHPGTGGVGAGRRCEPLAADSTYYQVEKIITGTPVLESLPAPELLAIDLDPDRKVVVFKVSRAGAVLRSSTYPANMGTTIWRRGGPRSPIDAVTYGTLQPDGAVRPENPFQMYRDHRAVHRVDRVREAPTARTTTPVASSASPRTPNRR